MNLRFSLFTFAILAPAASYAIDDRACGTIASPLKQSDYRGTTAVTANGRTCQYWTQQSPHSHGNTPAARPGKGLGDHNYCRNPDGEPRAWCYTMDPAKRWEFCDVPDCATYTPTATIEGGDVSPEAAALVTSEMIAETYSPSTVGWCVNAASGDMEVDKVSQDGIYATDAEGPGTCYNFCSPFQDAPGFVGMQWRDVSKVARCICFFDDGTLPEILPAGVDVKSDGISVGPVVGASAIDPSNGGGHYCYPYKGYMDANRRAIYGNAEPLTDYINFEIYGTTQQIANAEVQYDQNQNHIDKQSPTFDAATHTTLSAAGNTWSAYLLPEEILIHEDSVLQFDFSLAEDTVDGFQAVCLDYDTEETGSNGRCFVLRSSQGWIQDMINVPTQTMVGETSSHSIPVGDFFVGAVNYIAFIQDSDGQDRTKGSSSISGLKLLSLEDEYLEIEIDDQIEYLRNDQISFKNNGQDNEDTKDYWMHLSEDGKAVQINGNQWKAMPLNSPYNITAETILEFDIVVDQSVDYHAICLNAEPNKVAGNNCVVVQNPKEAATTLHHITTKLVTGEPKRIVLPFGSFMNLQEGEIYAANYLAFIQDNDQSALHNGRSTWSNFRLYQESRFPLVMTVFGASMTVANIQEPLQNAAGDIQDSRDHIMSISENGSTITATSNSWKMLKLPSTFIVTPATVLQFDFSLYQESELHAICLLDEIRIKDGRNDCYFTAGLQDHASSQGQKIEPYTAEGQSHHYEIQVGSFFTGEVKYLGIVVDNDLGFTVGDVERTLGQSSWSNIEVYNLPTLDIDLDGSTLSIDNHQISYDQNQDSTPIREHMAIIDGPSIRLVGNMWRALELPTPLEVADLGDFVLSFDYTVDEAAEIHAICFEEDLELGDGDNPQNSNPHRCIATAFFQDTNTEDYVLTDYQTRVGESHRFVLNLSKLFHRMYYGPIKYIAFVHDNDAGDKTGGNSTYANIAITTSLTSCLDDADFAFELGDCTAANFLSKIKDAMDAKGTCVNNDPVMELMSIFDAVQETDVYNQIKKICTSAYKLEQYDLADNQLGIDRATERQLVKEYIDGGSAMNYESEADSAVNVGFVNDQFNSSKLISWPKHHALDNCHIGAAMCCFVGSRTNPEPADNSDVCYVDMKASKRTAHVQDGWSIYGDDGEDVYCEGFAWGNDGGSLSSALKGNALFKVGFADMYTTGNVEQVPGAPLCGCMDRMPVVTNAACTSVTDAGSAMNVSFDNTVGLFRATLTIGTIEYGDCSGDSLVEHYETLVDEGKATSVDLTYMQERVVGDGGCHDAINGFLSKKGLVKA